MSADKVTEPNPPVVDETSSETVPEEHKQDPGTISSAASLATAGNVEKSDQENTAAESGTATENHAFIEPNQPVVDETSSASVTVPEEPKDKNQENTFAEGVTEKQNHSLEELYAKESTSTVGDVRSEDYASHKEGTSDSSEEESDSESDDSNEVILYHYTTEEGARGIRSDMKIEQEHSTYARWKHREHGRGVYFTQLNHYTERRKLITNNFMKSGETLKNEYAFLKRIAYVVKIRLRSSKVVEIRDGSRDIWIHKGDIDLKRYKGKHWIYSRQKPSVTL